MDCHVPIAKPGHGHIEKPRRCVDLSRTIWIIGYRYHCPSCLHPKSKKPTVTFRSWDSRILALLDHNLQAEFPAQLTHRSGITHHVLAFMRTCFQHGMGSKQFANALRVQHLQLHDELHLQYLHYLFSLFSHSTTRLKMGSMDSPPMLSGFGMCMIILSSTIRMTSGSILQCLQAMYVQSTLRRSMVSKSSLLC
jgi:hypothetical protein